MRSTSNAMAAGAQTCTVAQIPRHETKNKQPPALQATQSHTQPPRTALESTTICDWLGVHSHLLRRLKFAQRRSRDVEWKPERRSSSPTDNSREGCKFAFRFDSVMTTSVKLVDLFKYSGYCDSTPPFFRSKAPGCPLLSTNEDCVQALTGIGSDHCRAHDDCLCIGA